jgi:alpha-ketoglutarate-dependent taurine dioxygenase
MDSPDGRRRLEELAAAVAGLTGLTGLTDRADLAAAASSVPAPLPTDLPRPAERGAGGASLVRTLSATTVATLREVASRHRASRFMVGLAAFVRALAAWSGRRDLIIGVAHGGRAEAGSADVIDCLTNLVPVRLSVRPDEEFPDLLARVKAAALFAAEHQDVPFAALVDRLRAPRSTSANPLVQVAFGVQDVTRATYQDPDLRLHAEEVAPDRARLDLTVWIEETGDGARALWTYSTELYRAETIVNLHDRFVAALAGAFGHRPPTQQRRTTMDTDPDASRVIRRRGARRPATSHAAAANPALPARVHATDEGTSDLPTWISVHRDRVDHLTRTAGALLLRGFAVSDAAGFAEVMDALSGNVLAYNERSSPRSLVSGRVYTSTDHPADLPIQLHNEQSYTLDWPMRIVFFCEIAPADRGRTPLADSRRVLAALRPETVAAFERHGIRYVRNYVPGLGLSWQEAFQVDDRAEVEHRCRAADIACEWIGDDQLRTVQIRPAVRTHPVTGERTWFNHALFFHVTSMPHGADLLAAVGEENLPYQTFRGDGRRIEDAVLAELRAAYAAETTSFPWQRGDVLVVENMLTAHAREPFSGPRRILTAMADPASEAFAAAGKVEVWT